MIAIDTNVLVRAFVNDEDNPAQNETVRDLLKREKQVYVSQVVQIELVWVLSKAYKFDKAEVIKVLEYLHGYDVYQLESPKQFEQALELYRSSNADFPDYMIFANSQLNGYDFWTFDRKLANTVGVNRLV